MGKEETAPLLQQNNSGRPHDVAAVTLPDDGQFSLQHRSGDWRAPAIILGFKCLEGVASSSIKANLVIYLTSIFHETNAASATNTSTWTGTLFFTPLLGAIIADSFLGRHWTVLISATVNLLGMTTVTISSFLPSLRPPPCEGNLCPPATTAQNLVLFCGIYLVAFGCGAAKSSLIPLGAEQFYDENPADRERKATFLSSFYLCIILGNLVATTMIAWIQENVSWALGFGLGTLCVAVALGGFLLGTPIFRLERPRGSPLKSVAQVLVASLRKIHLDVPKDSGLLYVVKSENLNDHGGIHQLAHTDSFRFLDKAATVSVADMSNGYCSNDWNLCTVTQVEELKTLLRMLPIWISAVIYYSQFGIHITFIEQGNAMDRNIVGSFSIPPASLQAFEVLCVTCLSVLYDKILVPMVLRTYTGNRKGLSLLQRIGAGHLILVIAMPVAATLEAARLESASAGRLLSIAWQLPQYFLLACSEMLGSIGLLEFFYDQGPDTMKTMSSSFLLLSIALGNYLTSLFISCVMLLTTRGGQQGWLPDNLNNGHLDYIFWVLSALSTLNFVFYLYCTRNYTPKKADFESGDAC